MKNNSNATTYNFIAFIIGWALSISCPIRRQNALGNWLQLLGQYLETYAAIVNSNPTTSNTSSNITIPSEFIDEKILNELVEDIETIKQELIKLQKRE